MAAILSDTAAMRVGWIVVGIILVGCGGPGGGGKQAAPGGGGKRAAPAAPAAAKAEAAGKAKAGGVPEEGPDYCDRYSMCAEFFARLRWQSRQPEGSTAEPTAADLAPDVDPEVARCRRIVDALTEQQRKWLEVCTGCGGSCEVFGCLDNVPEDASELPECYIGDPGPPPETESEGEGEGDEEKDKE